LLHQFKTFNKDSEDIDTLVALAAFGSMIRKEYETLNVDEPEYVDVQLKSLRRTINARNADRKAARLREIDSRLDSLKTSAEKKAELMKERKELAGDLQNT
jgi:hypothetical protein